MPWNPAIYNQFKVKRAEPFYDLISHVQPKPGMRILDLGCGTGELTAVLSNRFSASVVLGVDSSAEMLANAPASVNTRFEQRTVEVQLRLTDKWDLILANASLQWVDEHTTLFPKLVDCLLPEGQLAVQMPSQPENKLNQLLLQLVQESPFREALNGFVRHSPVLSLDEYTQLLVSEGAKDLVVYQKVYPIIAQSTDTLYDFIAGSALVPYMERLSLQLQAALTEEFKARIAASFTVEPFVYSFKRVILVGRW